MSAGYGNSSVTLTNGFKTDLSRKIAENEDRIRENIEREILNGNRISIDALDIETDGLDADSMSDQKLRNELDKKVTKVIQAFYSDKNGGLNQAMSKLENELNNMNVDYDNTEDSKNTEISSVNEFKSFAQDNRGSMTGGDVLTKVIAASISLTIMGVGVSAAGAVDNLAVTWAAMIVAAVLGYKSYKRLV